MRRSGLADIKAGDKFKCSVCGNVVVIIKAGGGTLMCCSKSMEKISK
jgi:desulfoferrodoxin-like iron-binding protein